MTKQKETILCSNCNAPFHGLSQCKRTVDGYDPLFCKISDLADMLVQFAEYAEKRNQPVLAKAASDAYGTILNLSPLVNVYAQEAK